MQIRYHRHAGPPFVSKMLLSPYFPVIVSISFVIFLFILVKQSRKSHKKLPPGPPKLPLIGNLLQLLSPLPHYAIANLAKKYGPVMSLQLGEVHAVVISSAEAAEELLKTKELQFAQRPEVFAVDIMSFDHSSIVFAPYGDYWRNFRKISVNELLSKKRVQSFRSIREQEIWTFIEDVSKCEGTAINLSEKFFTVNNDITSLAVFSRRAKDQGEVMALLDKAIRVAAGFCLPDLYPSCERFLSYVTGLQPALEKIQKKMSKIMDDLITEHKLKRKDKTEHEDVVDVLLRIQESDKLDIPITDNNIKGVTMDLFLAGIETSATTAQWAMAELAKNPRVMKKAQAELRQALNGKTKIEEKDLRNLEYLKLVIKETLRLHPPGTLLPREARESSEIGGYHIPAKTKILINAWAIARDPNIWTEPESFKPERFQSSDVDFMGSHFEFIPFGGGRRICPGILFATVNIELKLAQLLYHFDWSLPDGTKPEDMDMNETFGMTTRKKLDLHLVPTVHISFAR